MRFYRLLGVLLFGTIITSSAVERSTAMPVAKDIGAASNDYVIDVRAGRGGGGRGGRGGGMRAGGMHGGGGMRAGGMHRGGGAVAHRNFNGNRHANVNRRANVNVNRHTHVNVNRVNRVNVVGRRPVRGWVARPYYGRIVGGVALGTMIAVTAGVVPVAPASNMCWFWADSLQVNGYWDYCVAPQ
jgi:hypothetical protein